MKFEEVCVPLNAYFSQHPVLRVLQPLAMPLMIGCAAVNLVGSFVSLGSIINTVVFMGFFLFLLMTVSTCDFRMTAVGLGIFCLDYAWSFLRSLVRYRSLNWSATMYLLVFGYLAYAAYRKAVSAVH